MQKPFVPYMIVWYILYTISYHKAIVTIVNLTIINNYTTENYLY